MKSTKAKLTNFTILDEASDSMRSYARHAPRNRK